MVVTFFHFLKGGVWEARSYMKPGNLGDPNNVEMYISENCLDKYMYFYLKEVKSLYGAYIFIINTKNIVY